MVSCGNKENFLFMFYLNKLNECLTFLHICFFIVRTMTLALIMTKSLTDFNNR